ncbi:STAS domain-containing protein [Streptomyces sp. NBC_00272]|uniref:STAS domain-containing protein n=1 Tax=Streptomyces sp. NBC_00272 TaxID=2975698 RepID=UPI002E29888B|nr:STAS domain-containing protein [Streptomyces sp. NBC_00272]
MHRAPLCTAPALGGRGAVVVVCTGEFDRDSVGSLSEACRTEAAGAKLLALDVAGVAFADSAFLSGLIRLRNSRPMVLAGPLPNHRRGRHGAAPPGATGS